MNNSQLFSLITGLTQHTGRPAAARRLAEYLGGEDLLLFIEDPELHILLPAPGFPQTLPGGREWRRFLQSCTRQAIHTGELPFPQSNTLRRAVGLLAEDGSAIVVLGGRPNQDEIRQLAMLMPLLSKAFYGEQIARIAEGSAALAHEAEEQARKLAGSLDVARRELQNALAEMNRSRSDALFLAEVSGVLAASFNYEATLGNMARLVVSRIADACAVDIIEEDEQVRRYSFTHHDPAQEALMREFILDHHGFAYTIPATTRAGAIDAMLHAPGDYLAMFRQLGVSYAICVPLLSRDHTLGAITLFYETTQPAAESRLVPLAEELAHRAAMAVENGRLYRASEQAIQVRDQFLSIAAHELKTPLTAIIGYLQLLQRRVEKNDADASTKKMLRVAGEQAERLNKLINTLLDLSRIQLSKLAIEHEPLDIQALVCRVIETLQPVLQNHLITYHGSKEPLRVEGDALRLDQVINNLINNAIKYSPAGGTVRVGIRRDGDWVDVAISDEGIGIPAESLPHLFRRFYRAPNVDDQNIGGMGIGLYIVKEIVALHGGTINVTSREGEGSTFTIRLPLAPAVAAAEGVQRVEGQT